MKFKYRSISRAFAMLMLAVFCTTTIAADSINCVCTAKQEVKKEMKCCSVKKEMKCCSDKEKKCGNTGSNKSKDCGHCTMKKNDVQNPLTTNENNIVKTNILKVSEEISLLNSGNFSIQSFNTWHPPEKTCKIYIALSNIRI